LARDHLGASSRFLVVGFVGPQSGSLPDSLGGIDDLVWILERYAIDTVMITVGLDDASLLEVLDVCDRTGCTALSVSPHFPVGGFIPRVVSRGPTPFVELIRPSLRAPQLAIKRAFDIVFATLLLILLSPLLALVALAVRASSRGRVIFTQDRVGYAGRIFTMYKFRTMVEDAEKARDALKADSLYEDARVFKIRNDPRVTRLGKILRRTSIDELPQLWNVLRGEMSLVGPRPPLAKEVAEYEDEHYTRFDMKPGITGPWQVAGRNEVTRFEEILALDAAYLTDWTIAKDFLILLRTIPAVITMRGAM
jgi:exopolysaccharide biosynthesis polyprenyl glycosylphosphotransferase